MKSLNNFDLLKFRNKFREGLYSNGRKLIWAWWDYEKTVVLFADSEPAVHTSMYPIVFHSMAADYIFIGEL